MPHEDFVYLGDHARLPYGPRPLEEIRRFAREIGAYLEQQDVKLILVACNAATSAALPRLQEELTVPVVGVDHARGARRRAGDAQPAGRPARHAGDGGRRAATPSSSTRSTRASRSSPVACPRLVPLIEGDDPYGEETERGRARVRGAAAGGRRRHRDPRLHALPADPHDLPARVRPRRDARLLGGGDGARGRARRSRARASRTTRGREGDYRFLTTGDPEAFRELGRRFLQLPIGEVEHVTVATLEEAAA